VGVVDDNFEWLTGVNSFQPHVSSLSFRPQPTLVHACTLLTRCRRAGFSISIFLKSQ
jgi:hypothetical protein